jgi:hypothetical protein
MADPNSLRDSADKAYGFWHTAGAWVAGHPKTTIAAALAAMVAAFLLGLAL